MANQDGSTGVEWRMYVNTSIFATPVWAEISAAKDISMPDDSDQIDTPERGLRYKLFQVGQADMSIEFPMTYRRSNTAQGVLRTNYDAQTDTDVLLLDGDETVAANEGVRMISKIMSFGNTLGLTDGAEVAVMFKPTFNADIPDPVRFTTT